ncbi:3909_t:CDS:2, partial [Scutellospora calospora]
HVLKFIARLAFWQKAMEKLKKKHRLASPRNTNKTTVSNNPQKFQPSQTLRKRNPQRPATIPTDVYVSRSSNFKGQLLRAEKLLIKDSHPSITIHGLGAAIQKSINLVLALKDLTHNQIAYKVTTGTVELIDDIIPDDDVKFNIS